MPWHLTQDRHGYERGPYTVRYNRHARKWEGWRNRGYTAADQVVRMHHAMGNRDYVARGCVTAAEARRACDEHALEAMT